MTENDKVVVDLTTKSDNQEEKGYGLDAHFAASWK
jgi:hypothetical protein